MRKKITTLLAATAFMVLTAATSAMALPTLPSDFHWSNTPFWTPTDATTPPATGNSQFTLEVQSFANQRDANFGLFSVADTNNPANPLLFQIFATTDAANVRKTVSFRESTTGFQVRLGTGTWQDFGKTFGFYFDFVVPPNDLGAQSQKYFSFAPLDTFDDGKLNVFTARNDFSEVLVYLDRFGTNSAEYQMRILGNDLAPVPEPGTMMLLGAGFLGLAIYGKRRRNA